MPALLFLECAKNGEPAYVNVMSNLHGMLQIWLFQSGFFWRHCRSGEPIRLSLQ